MDDITKLKKKQRNFITAVYLLYTSLIYFVIVYQMPTVLESSYNGLLYPYDFKFGSAIVAIITSVVLILCIRKYYININNVSDITVQLLILLYFIPGLFVCCVTEIPRSYLFSYILFIVLFIYFDRKIVINNKELSLAYINRKIPVYLIYCIFAVTIMFVVYFGQEFSWTRFLLALTAVYDIRAEAEYFHWFIYNIELWAVYFGAIMIVYCIRSERKRLAWLIVICELFFFSMQANKIDLFVTLVAIICGYKKIDNKLVSLVFVLLAAILYIECKVFDDGMGIATNVFRRYTIVPNRISTHYFDFFQTHEPDYLRTPFSRIAALIGQPSPYSNIAHTIGNNYYNVDMGANTGMMASGLFLFGNIGIIIEAFCIPLFLKLFNLCTKGIQSYSINILIAIILTTLLINSPHPLINLFWISYFLFLFVSLYICRSEFSHIK